MFKSKILLTKKVILLILDGWGISSDKNESAIANAKTPFIDKLLVNYSNAELITNGRVILLSFIIFELVAQAYLVATFYSFKEKLLDYINPTILKLKLILVSFLIIVALISVPIISLPGNDFFGFNLKFFKHALEWDYFLGIISFYFLTFLMWKKN